MKTLGENLMSKSIFVWKLSDSKVGVLIADWL